MIALTQTIWTSSLLILTVIILRAVLGTHIPARLRYALWLLPALRLCVPISIQQALHLMPQSRRSVIDLPHAAGMHAPAPIHIIHCWKTYKPVMYSPLMIPTLCRLPHPLAWQACAAPDLDCRRVGCCGLVRYHKCIFPKH